MDAKSKLLEGYMDYLKNSSDPNLEKCKREHGQNFISHSINAWKSEMRHEDHELIPSKEIIREVKAKSAHSQR